MDRVCSLAAFSVWGIQFRSVLLAAVFELGASGITQSLAATPPEVSFDVSPSVGCRDVTTSEFASANPDERLVEARIEVSSLIRQGAEGDLLQFFYRFDSPRQTMRMVDYLPRTTLASDLAGNVTVEKKQESTKGIGGAVTAPLAWPLKVTGSGELAAKSTDSTRYELVPPMNAVAASGTLDRGSGVYFKLKPSRSTSLEGAKHFAIVFRVPRSWRADYVHLSCSASASAPGLFGTPDGQVVCGQRKFVVALYAEGDASAKAAAGRLVRAEAELLKTISANRKELQRRFYPSVVQRVGAMLEGADAALPHEVAETLVYGGQAADSERLELRLPPEIRQAVAKYAVARRALFCLPAGEASDMQ